ncbi:MAG TPA: sulfatase [Spirochaetota bacterium]|nr:sulfatase [Spirochaetota bacterium]
MTRIGTRIVAAFTRGDMGERGAALWRSFAVGAAVFACAFVFGLLYSASFSVMGVRVQALEDFVFAEFKWLILLHQAKVLAAYVAIGGASGAAAGYCIYLWCAATLRRVTTRKAVVTVALYSTVFMLAFLLADIRNHPALYNEHFHARGAVLAGFQMLVTHGVPGLLVDAFRLVVCAGFIPITIGVMVQLGGALYGACARLPRRALVALTTGAALAALIWLVPFNRNDGPNLIIIAADSFRYDRVSAWGSRKGLTPNIDALAAEGTSFHDFHVQLPRTFPSWYSLLSGRYPAQHGIRHMFPSRDELAAARLDLPEALRKNGYVTSAVADYAGDIFSRMSCFDRVRAPSFNFTTLIRQRGLEIHFFLLPFIQNATGRRLFPEARAFAQNSDPAFLIGDIKSELDALARRKRFLLTVFFSATHFPYASPHPYYKKYTDPAYRGQYRYLKINNPLSETLVARDDRRQIEGLFDGACSAVDDAVGEVVDYLKRRGLYDNSIIVFTADHGENLYDHGLDLGHGEHVRGEYATHVPMIIKFHRDYALKARTRGYMGVVQQIDFAPTVLDILGVKDAKTDAAGISYRSVIEGRVTNIPRIAYAETGIWFVPEGGQFFQRLRIRYPDVSVLCELAEPDMGVVLKDEYRDLINIAKHRTVFDETHKLIYMPTRDGVRYELLRRGDTAFVNRVSTEGPAFARLQKALRETVLRHENVAIVNGLFIPKRER